MMKKKGTKQGQGSEGRRSYSLNDKEETRIRSCQSTDGDRVVDAFHDEVVIGLSSYRQYAYIRIGRLSEVTSEGEERNQRERRRMMEEEMEGMESNQREMEIDRYVEEKRRDRGIGQTRDWIGFRAFRLERRG